MLEAVATVVVSVAVFCWWLLPILALGVFALRLRRQRARGGGPVAPPPAATAGD